MLPNTYIVSAPHPHELMQVCLHLRCRPSSPGLPALEEFTDTLPHKRKHLSHEEFESLYGADPKDIEAVKAFAKAHDLGVLAAEAAHRLVTVIGTVEALSRAFSVCIVHFRHPLFTYRGHKGAVHIPEELADIVTSVHGLDNRPVVQPFLRHHPGTIFAPAPLPFNPLQLAEIYNFPKDLNGAGQSIAIIELGGGYYPQCLASYFRDYLKAPVPKIFDVSVDGGYNYPGVSPSDGEVQLDIEVIGALASGADMYVYFARNTTASFLKAIKQAVHDKTLNHSIISISWGMSENLVDRATLTAFNQTLQEAAAKGITVLVASGDTGSYFKTQDKLAHPDFPASSPFALACGGTNLEAPDNKIEKEVVWNQGSSGSSGGGVSAVFPVPPYQKNAGLNPESVNPGHQPGRGIPDVCAVADPGTGYIISVNGKYQVSGGTSAVAPLCAALVARINQKLNARVGFINPFLYKIGKTENAFNDITEGNNAAFMGVAGYSAEPGWDACTGWGSPNGENLLKALEK